MVVEVEVVLEVAKMVEMVVVEVVEVVEVVVVETLVEVVRVGLRAPDLILASSLPSAPFWSTRLSMVTAP